MGKISKGFGGILINAQTDTINFGCGPLSCLTLTQIKVTCRYYFIFSNRKARPRVGIIMTLNNKILGS